MIAPLTGLPVPASAAAWVEGPALAAKIDAAAAAVPQSGLEEADVVLEARVEGISRYLAVWHSARPPSVGPVRSARTSDPDLLALLGHPLFAYSGGNAGVLDALAADDLFTDVGFGAFPGAYRRSADRRAPHNLYADTSDLFEAVAGDPGPTTPPAMFTYSDPTDSSPGPDPSAEDPERDGSSPSNGFRVRVGSEAEFLWDPESLRWRRFVEGRVQPDTSGGQLAVANVVVLQVEYVPSAADPDSPEARSTGSGRAWVYSGGRVVPGSWERPSRTEQWALRDPQGRTIQLRPGRTWVVLTGDAPSELDPAALERLSREATAFGGGGEGR
ncbi:MAG: DUF3048 domain-containing protein [Microthrixaceae bacterium]